MAVENLFPGTSSVKSIAELASSTIALAQFYPESGAGSQSGFQPDRTAHPIDSFLRYRQPDSRPWIDFLTVQAIEQPKNPFLKFFCNTNTVVFYPKIDIFLLSFCINSHLGSYPRLHELNTIGEQVNQDLQQCRRMSQHRR